MNSYHRRLFQWAILPYLVWILYPLPNRIGWVIYHLTHGNKPKGPLSFRDITFYFQMLHDEYLLALMPVLLFGFLFILGLISLAKRRRWAFGFLYSYVCFALFSTILSRNQEVRFILNFVPVLWLGAACGVAALASRRVLIPVSVVAVVLMALHFKIYRGGLKDPALLGQMCYGNETTVAKVRSELIAKLNGSRKFMGVGLSDMTFLAPLIELELHRAFPAFSSWPLPAVSDYGYQTSAEQHFQKESSRRNLEWVALFRKMGNEPNVEVDSVWRILRGRKDFEKINQFALPELGYEAELYRIN